MKRVSPRADLSCTSTQAGTDAVTCRSVPSIQTPRRWLMPPRSVRSHRRNNFLVVWCICLVYNMLWQEEICCSFGTALRLYTRSSWQLMIRSSTDRCRVTSINWCSSSLRVSALPLLRVPYKSALCRVISTNEAGLTHR